MTPVGCSTHFPEVHFQNVMAMMKRACQAKCGGIVGILKQLGATMNYKENLYERKMRAVLKSWNDKKLIATLNFALSSASL